MGKSSSVIIIYTTLALLLLVLLSSLFSPTNPHHRHRLLRRLILRPNSSSPGCRHHPPIPFDPIISDIEIRREDKQWEREHFSILHLDGQGEAAVPEWEDIMNAEDYINDDGRFNVSPVEETIPSPEAEMRWSAGRKIVRVRRTPDLIFSLRAEKVHYEEATDRIVLLFPNIDVSPSDGFVSSDELVEWNLQQATRETMQRTQRDMELRDKNHDGFVSFHEYEGPTWDRHSDGRCELFNTKLDRYAKTSI